MNKTEKKEYMKRWRANNLDKLFMYTHGTLTCYLCLKPIEFGNDHLEHIIPLSRGGTNERENLNIACASCNFKKRNKTVSEFKLWQMI